MKSATATIAAEAPAPDIPAQYGAAATAWREIDAKMKDLRGEIERRRLAINLSSFTEIPERARHVAATVTSLITASSRSPLRAASDIEGLEFDLAELQPAHVAAHDEFVVARSAMAAHVAMSFRERHLEATKNIISAIEALSVALEEERDVRAAYARQSPEPTSHLLPDITADLREMDLTRWDSTVSVWARQIRNFGVVA